MVKRYSKLALILGLILYTFKAQSQTINYVKQENPSVINVYFVNNKSEADAIVYISSYKSYSKKLGIWYLNDFIKGRGVEVFVSSKSKANVKIFLTKWRHEVKVNETYKIYFKNK